jgi:hypothetical protein
MMMPLDPLVFVLALALQSAPTMEPPAERPAEPPPPQVPSALPPVPETPGAPMEIVACQPFTLDQPYPHRCRRDGGEVRSGHLVVVRAAAGFVTPRQVAEPVLCFGSQTGERLWSSPERGLAIYLVPSWDEGSDANRRPGDPMADLVYFASPELPERVDAAWIAAERARAESALRSGRVQAPVRPDGALKPAVAAGSADALVREAERLLSRDPNGTPISPRTSP